MCEKKIDVLCIGSAVLDIMANPVGQNRIWAEKQRISSIRIQAGGDALNQSVHLADLGVCTALAACTGSDQNGRILRNILEERGVETQYLTVKKEFPTGTALVLVDELGERHTFSVFGAHSTLACSDLPVLPEPCRAISLGSLFSMPELEKEGLVEYLQEARRKKVLVFADLASDKLGQGLAGIERFLPYIDYFLPSLYDAFEMTKASDVSKAAEQYKNLGVGCVVIKCGSDGCYYMEENNTGMIPAVHVRPVDTTGAGDCMSALFLSQILQGESVEAACRFACAGASYSTLFPGASTEKLTKQRILEWMQGRKKNHVENKIKG